MATPAVPVATSRIVVRLRRGDLRDQLPAPPPVLAEGEDLGQHVVALRQAVEEVCGKGVLSAGGRRIELLKSTSGWTRPFAAATFDLSVGEQSALRSGLSDERHRSLSGLAARHARRSRRRRRDAFAGSVQSGAVRAGRQRAQRLGDAHRRHRCRGRDAEGADQAAFDVQAAQGAAGDRVQRDALSEGRRMARGRRPEAGRAKLPHVLPPGCVQAVRHA